MSYKITLHKDKGIALVDAHDYHYLMNPDWNWCFARSNGYALRYFKNADKRGSVLMHRVIVTRMLGHPIQRGLQVDHINQNRLDNRRCNLRLASRSENQWNKSTPHHSSTGYKGVVAAGEAFDAHIKVYRRRIYLGRFATAEEAAMMYDCASRDLHGDYSHPNLPEQNTPATIEQRWQKLLARKPEIKTLTR